MLKYIILNHVFCCRLVYDRETGKPKGYGFCEYKDQETALSAMRNLNGYEIGGRTLRVDNACTEKSRMEMQRKKNLLYNNESCFTLISVVSASPRACRGKSLRRCSRPRQSSRSYQQSGRVSPS